MATVFRARDTELRRDVAVKVLFPHLSKRRDVVARFQREARAAAGLEQEHILRVYDVGGGPGPGPGPHEPPYIVLELVRGPSLRDVAGEHGPMPAELVACVGIALCDALAVAHEAGIVHRDVKPANIMVAEDGRLVLGDFGVARVEDEDSVVTRTGAILGTPAFMSPEQAFGSELDARSDLYSLGATLYRLSTGQLPFSGPTPRVVSQIAAGQLTSPQRVNPKIGPDLTAIIEALMDREPEARPASATEVGASLRELAEASGFEDPAAELAAYFADPERYVAGREPAILRATVRRAREALEARQLPRAMALTDRALAIDPDDAEAGELVDELGQGPRRARWLAVVGVAVLVAIGSVAVMVWPEGAAPMASGAIADAGAPDATLATGPAADAGGLVTSTMAADAAPAGADRDARAAAAPVRTRSTRPPERPRPRRRPTEAPPDAAPRVPPDAEPPPDARPAPATVSLAMDAWCDVVIDGDRRGRARPGERIELAPGRHRIECTQGPGLGAWRTTVELEAGEHRRLEGHLLRPVEVTIELAGGAVASISGKRHRDGAKVELRPGRYRVDILDARGHRRAGAWITIPTVSACTLKDRPALDCYR